MIRSTLLPPAYRTASISTGVVEKSAVGIAAIAPAYGATVPRSVSVTTNPTALGPVSGRGVNSDAYFERCVRLAHTSPSQVGSIAASASVSRMSPVAAVSRVSAFAWTSSRCACSGPTSNARAVS